jgi:hypothetical protein
VRAAVSPAISASNRRTPIAWFSLSFSGAIPGSRLSDGDRAEQPDPRGLATASALNSLRIENSFHSFYVTRRTRRQVCDGTGGHSRPLVSTADAAVTRGDLAHNKAASVAPMIRS